MTVLRARCLYPTSLENSMIEDPTFESSPYLDKWLEKIKTEPALVHELPETALLVLELDAREKDARPNNSSLGWLKQSAMPAAWSSDDDDHVMNILIP